MPLPHAEQKRAPERRAESQLGHFAPVSVGWAGSMRANDYVPAKFPQNRRKR